MKFIFKKSSNLKILLKSLIDNGGEPIAVGGCVRDSLLGKKINDIDIEVYNLNLNKIIEILKPIGKVNVVGKHFGVLKVAIFNNANKEDNFDISIPRRESKIGIGHKAFSINYDIDMTFKDASLRRDFTINSIGYNFKLNKILDPHNGIRDLKNNLLKHVSKSFIEDPLRVFRACQLSARFKLKISPSTLLLCRKIKNELGSISRERIFQEFKKMLLSENPSIGLSLLKETNAIKLFPEIQSLIGCKQEKEWHPEGDVWTHTLLVVDKTCELIKKENINKEESIVLLLASLCHDLGKPIVTCFEDGRIRSKNHEAMGKIPTKTFLDRIGAPKKIINDIVSLVINHLKPYQLFKVKDNLSDGAINRLSTRVSISRLCIISKADFLGRTTKDALSKYDPSSEWLLDKAKQLLVEKNAPINILSGKHLIRLKLNPGPNFSKILKKAFIAQLNGEFNSLETGMIWLKSNYKNILKLTI